MLLKTISFLPGYFLSQHLVYTKLICLYSTTYLCLQRLTLLFENNIPNQLWVVLLSIPQGDNCINVLLLSFQTFTVKIWSKMGYKSDCTQIPIKFLFYVQICNGYIVVYFYITCKFAHYRISLTRIYSLLNLLFVVKLSH